MSKYKKGDKVVIRKDLVAGVYYGSWFWNTDKDYMKEKDYVVIEGVDNEGHYIVENIRWSITDEMIAGLYKDVEKVKITKKQRIEKLESDYKLLNENYTKLLDTVSKLTAISGLRVDINLDNDTIAPKTSESVSQSMDELTPNQKRKQIIEEAKEFVKEVELEDVNVPLHYIVDFKKRTVSAYTDVNLILSTVKCLPEDVFNVHIGKALALAKRYDMKDEIEKFSNAIRPTEKVEGMKVKYERAGDILKIVSNNDDVICGETSHTDSLCAALSRIYDDSNAKY